MEYARKMILIPQECIRDVVKLHVPNKQGSGGAETVQTPGTEASRLDDEMAKILNISSIDDREKSLLYQQALQRFLHFKSAVGATTVAIREGESETKTSTTAESDILDAIPQKFRMNAKNLIQRLRIAGNVSWDQRGVLSIDGSVVRGTNIVDLINDAMRVRKRPPPRGHEQFARALRQAGIPREFIGNQNLWNIVAESSSAPTSDSSFAGLSAGEEEEEDAVVKGDTERKSTDLKKNKRKREGSNILRGDQTLSLPPKKARVATPMISRQWERIKD